MQNQKNSPGIKPIWVALIAVLAVAAIAVFASLYWRSQSQLKEANQKLQEQQNDPAAAVRDENKALVEKVGQLMVLPKNELPTVATVSDLDKLKGQAFFEQAKLGDKVLIYSQAKQAILYRPTSNQIVTFAPLIGDTNEPGAPMGAPTGGVR